MTANELIERVKDSILRDVDGSWYFWPSEGAGSWQSWALRVIADELDKRNKEVPAPPRRKLVQVRRDDGLHWEEAEE